MIRSRNLLSAALLAAASLCFGSATQAAILHGDFSDVPPGGVMYLDVEESSFSVPVPPNELYGAPTVTSNLLDFDNMAFGTSSSDGASSLIDGQLNFTIMALPGAGLTAFSIVEGGDYSFTGVTPTPGTFVSASAGATISILEIDDVPLGNPVTLTAPISTFASDTFVTDYPTTGGAPSTGLLPWSLVTFVDLGPVLPSGHFATKIEVAIDNQLSTATTPGNQAAIAKKDFKIIPVGDLIPNDIVPEPASILLVCLLGMLGVARRVR